MIDRLVGHSCTLWRRCLLLQFVCTWVPQPCPAFHGCCPFVLAQQPGLLPAFPLVPLQALARWWLEGECILRLGGGLCATRRWAIRTAREARGRRLWFFNGHIHLLSNQCVRQRHRDRHGAAGSAHVMAYPPVGDDFSHWPNGCVAHDQGRCSLQL